MPCFNIEGEPLTTYAQVPCRANVLGVSCAAGPAWLWQSVAAVAANDVRSTEWRTAPVVPPPRLRQGRQLGCRAEAGPRQLHTKVSQRSTQRVISRCLHSSNAWADD